MTDPDALPWTADAALSALATQGERTALVLVAGDAATPVSGARLRALALGAAAALAARGVEKGTVVALWAPNSAGWIAAALGCLRLGAVLAPIDAAFPEAEALAQAEASGARLLLIAHGRGAGGATPTMDLGEIGEAAAAPAARLDPSDPVALFRTSGTTGAPKIFTLTLRNIGWNVRAIAGSGLVTGADRVLSPLPFHHVFPWITGALTCLTVGATIVLPEGLTGPQLAVALRQGRPTVILGVPKLFEALLDGVRSKFKGKGRLALSLHDGLVALAKRLRRASGGRAGSFVLAPIRRMIAPQARMLVSGGAALKPETEETLEAFGWDVRSGYGLSETAASVTAPIRGKRAGSVGQPLAGCEVRIDAPNAKGDGEILLRGPMVFSGYADNPEANARAFDAEGFFRTGDLGRVDADGYVYVTGRAKELIVLAGGENVFPEDVEAAYAGAPVIGEIAALERNGALVALIVPNMAEVAKLSARQPESALRVALAEAARALPSTWRLAGFAMTREPLPRTRLGKLRRFQLPALYERALSGAGVAARPLTEEETRWASAPPRGAVWARLKRDHAERPFDLDSHLQLDLGLDSFGWMTLAVDIEEATGVRLEAADIAEIGTVRELLTRVSEKAPEAAGAARVDRAALLAEDRARWLAPQGPAERLAGAALGLLNAGLMRLLFRLRVTGSEGLPAAGPLILCPNHASYLDALFVAAALPRPVRRRASWAAHETQMFHTRAHRWLARAMRAFPVREVAPTQAIDLAAEAVSGGAAQVLFPEGWISPDGKLMPFPPGVGHLALRTGAPIVPVRIAGAFEAMPRGATLPRLRRVSVTFGAPLPVAALAGDAADEGRRAQAVADALRRRMLDQAGG